MTKGLNNLGLEVFRSLKRNPWRLAAIDYSQGQRKEMRSGTLLALASALADKLRQLPDPRVGIVFPPSFGGWIANVAVILAGKSSVNFNFTASPAVLERMIALSGVRTVITSQALIERFKDFPWQCFTVSPGGILDLGKFLAQPEVKKSLLGRALASFFLPRGVLKKFLGLEALSDVQITDEATLLFSSGSTAMPKAIPLSHANLLANIEQIEDIKLLPRGTRLLASLPLFHSFGLMVTLWYPIARPIHGIICPNPLDCASVARAVSQEKVHIIAGTASFFRLYLKQIPPAAFKSLRGVVAGAEKTPKGQHERWKEYFGSEYMEGYGLTETSPVISVNVPGHNRIGTVGRVLKGIQARIVDEETREVLSAPAARGILEVKGPNVFLGYLGDDKTSTEILRDGWFWTGDRGSLSADGYLTIEGRLRRFSKIGGEMVSHLAVEEEIAAAFGWQDLWQMPFVVTGCRDEVKGECLVVVCSQPIDINDLRARLQDRKVPNLWIPRKIVHVEAMPYMANGKLDILAVEKLAQG